MCVKCTTELSIAYAEAIAMYDGGNLKRAGEAMKKKAGPIEAKYDARVDYYNAEIIMAEKEGNQDRIQELNEAGAAELDELRAKIFPIYKEANDEFLKAVRAHETGVEFEKRINQVILKYETPAIQGVLMSIGPDGKITTTPLNMGDNTQSEDDKNVR